jgi:hypothetical protein
MNINYGNMYLGAYAEFVVDALRQRGRSVNPNFKTRTGTIRAILSRSIPGHYTGKALDDYVVNHCERERVHRLDFVQVHVGTWIIENSGLLAKMGISEDKMQREGEEEDSHPHLRLVRS